MRRKRSREEGEKVVVGLGEVKLLVEKGLFCWLILLTSV